MEPTTAIPIYENDVKELGDKLVRLERLSDAERSLLWAVFTIAADVLSPTGDGVGKTSLVKSDSVDDLTVELEGPVEAFLHDFDGTEVPDRVAKAFAPGSIEGVARPVEPLTELKVTDGLLVTVKTPERPTKPSKSSKPYK